MLCLCVRGAGGGAGGGADLAQEKADEQRADYSKQVQRMQRELDELRGDADSKKEKQLQQELASEDSERQLRNLTATVEDLEGQVESLSEDNIFLKDSLEELQESSTEKEFRLQEELRGAPEYPNPSSSSSSAGPCLSVRSQPEPAAALRLRRRRRSMRVCVWCGVLMAAGGLRLFADAQSEVERLQRQGAGSGGGGGGGGEQGAETADPTVVLVLERVQVCFLLLEIAAAAPAAPPPPPSPPRRPLSAVEPHCPVLALALAPRRRRRC